MKKSWLSILIGIALSLGNTMALSQEECGIENGAQRYCTDAYPYIWVFGKESYSLPGNFFHGSAPSDAEWEYMSGGYDSPQGCEQNASGPIIAAPDITIRAAANPKFTRIRAEIPITILLTGPSTLPRQTGPVLSYGLQANGKDLGPVKSVDFSELVYDQRRRYADYQGTLLTSVEIKNEELKNVKVVIYNLAQKPSTTIRNLCYEFGIILGKGRLDLTP